MKCAGCHRDSPDVFIADGTGWMHWQCEIDRLTARVADLEVDHLAAALGDTAYGALVDKLREAFVRDIASADISMRRTKKEGSND